MIPINVIIFGYHFIRATNELNTNSFEKYNSVETGIRGDRRKGYGGNAKAKGQRVRNDGKKEREPETKRERERQRESKQSWIL